MQEGSHLALTDAERRQRHALRRNQALASGLLVAAIVAFGATHLSPAPGFWVLLLRAGAEAAVVGGLADWFAVTALFRHPLGLPIPHTAIVPRSKDRIGAGLGNFVERYFLAPEIIAARLRRLELGRRFAGWLGEHENAIGAADQIVELLPYVINSLGDPMVRDFVARSFGEQLKEVDLAPIAGRLITLFTASSQYDALFDRALDAAQAALADNADRIFAIVEERSRWWVPKTVNRQIATALITGIEEVLAELRLPDSDARERCRAAIEDFAAGLVASPERRRRFDEAKNRLIEHPQVEAWLGSVWDELRRLFLADIAAPASRSREAARTAMLSLGQTLARDLEMQARLDATLEHAALAVVPWRGQIGGLINEVVRSWDARTVTRRLELAIGSDLQYIRMNGTLVGACVGCALYLVSHYLFRG
ncbi:MAG TPA: DUF445 domain-containing protein [Stellaceae bacterium]|nr:DUF445 domain-containing protein [Stellaceae bacterium]